MFKFNINGEADALVIGGLLFKNGYKVYRNRGVGTINIIYCDIPKVITETKIEGFKSKNKK
jgi:hypothetical protein